MAVTPWKKAYRVGGTMEFAGFDNDLNDARLDMLVEGAMEYLIEGVAPGAPRKWAGFRPMTPDDLPIIGPAKPRGSFIACGHNMLGMSMAAGTGRLIAELVKGKRPHIDVAPYRPDRFVDQPPTLVHRWWRDRQSAKTAAFG